MKVKRGDVVNMVSLRDGTTTLVIVESVDLPGDFAIVRPVHDEGRWRVSTGFLTDPRAR